ncbi:hypothetical protein VPH35_075495 [Triticum aestivum]|uniref:uncharacterized protein n=1 Tax=Triticum aestivum TaxID=4565 RepID=UPI00162CB691|nr:uncharacterized protein LOC123089640 [Triticum aestivum]
MEGTEKGPCRGCPGPADLISPLPEDLLLQVLERLGCAGEAARTSLLSRRWRGLWTRLPSLTVALHDVLFSSLEAALARAARPGVWRYHLDIRVPWQADTLPAASISLRLHAAAALSPVDMLFVLSPDVHVPRRDLPDNLLQLMLHLGIPWSTQVSPPPPVDLPRFCRAATIDLRARHLRFRQPSSGFPLLKTLSLTGCDVDLATLIPLCPRIRVLTVDNNGLAAIESITIHSASLEELSVESRDTWTSCVDVKAPVLEQLTVSFHARGDLRVFVLAPMVEKFSWRCSYPKPMYRLGLWGLLEVGLNTIDSGKGGCLELPNGYVLSLHMAAQGSYKFLNAEHTFAGEIDKHMVTKFSGLDLHLRTTGHAIGAVVLRLIGMHRIRTVVRNLRIILLKSEEKEACPVNCFCDEPKDWRTQTISFVDLETVDIEGVDGEDREFDFLEVIFTCAPMLRRVTVKLADGVNPCADWCTKVNNIFKAHPFVKCNIDLGQYVADKVLH